MKSKANLRFLSVILLIFVFTVLESVVKHSINTNNTIPKENKHLNDSQYWSLRSGTPSTKTIEKYNNDVLNLFAEY